MAIEFFDGFENGTSTAWNLNARFTVGTVGNGRNGGRALESNSAGFSSSLNLPATPKKTIGAAFYWNSTSGLYGSNSGYLYQFAGDAGATVHLTLSVNGSGQLVLRRGNMSTGTIIATSTLTLPYNQWRYVEMSATLNDTTGTCIVRLDGVEAINFTGDTRNAGTAVNIDTVNFYVLGSSGNNPSIDDLYTTNGTDATATTGRKDDGFLGDIKVELLLPNAEGASLQWTPSTGTVHWSLVDENPPNTTDYVSAITDGLRDLWDLPSLSVSVATVLAVQTAYYCAKSDAGAASFKPLIRESSGTITADTAIPLSTTYGYSLGSMQTTKPAGGAWTVADVNGLQVGVEKSP